MRSVVCLVAVLVLMAGCTGKADDKLEPDETPTTDASPEPDATSKKAPSQSTPPAPGTSPVATTAAPSDNPNLRVEDYPFAMNVSKATAMRIPSGGTKLVLLESDKEFSITDSVRDGPEDSPWWVWIHARNATWTPRGDCHFIHPNTLHLWSNLVDNGDPGTSGALDEIGPGSYIMLVHDPDGKEVRLGFGASTDGDDVVDAKTVDRDYATTAFAPDIAGSGIAPYTATFTQAVDVPSRSMFLTTFRNSATLQSGGGNASVDIIAPTAFNCHPGIQSSGSGLIGQATATNVNFDAYLNVTGTYTWTGEFSVNANYEPNHSAAAVLISYTGDRTLRPYWVP